MRFHCWSRGIRYSAPAMRSESCDVSVRGTYPSVVVGNGFAKVERLLLESELVNPWANGTRSEQWRGGCVSAEGRVLVEPAVPPPTTSRPLEPKGCHANPRRGANLSRGAPFS